MFRRKAKADQPRTKPRKPTTSRDPRTGGTVSAVNDTQPYWEIVPDSLDPHDKTGPASSLLDDGTFEVGVRIRPPSRLLMSEHVLNGRHFDLKAVLKLAVPVGERARIYIMKLPARHEDLAAVTTVGRRRNEVAGFLVDKKMALLDERRRKGRLKRWEFFVTLSVRPPLPFSRENPPSDADLRAAVQRVQSRRRDLINRLRNAGYHAESMNAQEIKDACFYYNTPDAMGGPSAEVVLDEAARLKNMPVIDGDPDPLTISRQVMQSPLHVEDKAYLVNGSTLVYAVSLHDLPRYTEFGLFQEVAENIRSGNMVFCIEYQHLDPQGELERMEGAKRGLYSAVNSTKYAPSASALQRHKEVNETLEHVYDSKDDFYTVGVSVLLFAKNQEQMTEMLNEATSAFARFQASRPVMHGWQSIAVYEACAPFNGRRTEFPFKAVESNAVGFMPPIAPFPGIGKPTIVYRNAADGLTVFDPFAAGTSASHFIVIGPTGWGKTFNVVSQLNGLVDHYNPWVTIIDRKNDLKDWILGIGGLHIVMGGKGDTTLNPLDLPPGERMPDAGKLLFLLTLVRNFAPPGRDERVNGEEDTIIEEAFKLTYMAHSQESEPPIMSDVRDLLETMSQYSDGRSMSSVQREMARSLATRLRRFLGDSDWGQLIDRRTSENARKPARQVYYDLSNIGPTDEKRRKIAMHIISDRVLQTAKLAPEHDWKICFIDEMTQQIKTETDRNYISEWLRLGRSFGLAVGGAMQLPSDTKYMPELNESFNFIWLGKVGKPQKAVENLDLPETIADAVGRLTKVDGEYADWLLVYRPEDGDPDGEIVRVEESREMFWLQSSKKEHRRLRRAAILRRGGDILGAVEDLAAGNYPDLPPEDEDEAEVRVSPDDDGDYTLPPQDISPDQEVMHV